MKIKSLYIAAFLLVLPSVCLATPKPDLYPNKHLKIVGQVQANRDTIDCRIQAEDYLASSYSQDNRQAARREALRRGARGAALGALGSTITKNNAGRGAGAGAAIAGTASMLDSRRQQRELQQSGSPQYKKYVEACLEDRGYRVVGWG